MVVIIEGNVARQLRIVRVGVMREPVACKCIQIDHLVEWLKCPFVHGPAPS